MSIRTIQFDRLRFHGEFVPERRTYEAAEERTDTLCPECGCKRLRRLARRGFLQRKVYSRFGYYPWECAACREPLLLKKRLQRKSKSHTAA
jgi:hypothetical protein